MDKLVMVIGPTGVGKSDIAIKIAKHLNTGMINGDSIQVYRGLDIGSAKMKQEECEGIPQYLIDILNVDESFSVSQFQTLGRQAADELIRQGKVPVVVGGTGLYTRAMVYDYSFREGDEGYAEYIEQRRSEDPEKLYKELLEKDPQAAKKIHPNNVKRVIRALYICSQGTTKSENEDSQKHEPVYDLFIVGCTRDRKELYERIDRRVSIMVEKGLPEEIKGLLDQYPDLWSYQSMQGIGYKEWKEYFDGTLTLDETMELIRLHTRQFAKRQYTWFKHQLPQNWYDLSDPEEEKRVFRDLDAWLKTTN